MRLNTFTVGGCKGTTKLGKPCQARDVFENGFCKHHGGAGKLPRLERLKEKWSRKIKRSLARSRRLDREISRAAKDNPRLAEILKRIEAKDGWQTQN